MKKSKKITKRASGNRRAEMTAKVESLEQSGSGGGTTKKREAAPKAKAGKGATNQEERGKKNGEPNPKVDHHGRGTRGESAQERHRKNHPKGGGPRRQGKAAANMHKEKRKRGNRRGAEEGAHKARNRPDSA